MAPALRALVACHSAARITALAACLCGCSPVLELSKPDPVDLSAFQPGMAHKSVLAKLGAPLASAPHQGQDCDFYKLYTTGLGSGGRAAIALVEAGGYVATLGLSEILFTPAELAAHKGKKTVTFCYTEDQKLARVVAQP